MTQQGVPAQELRGMFSGEIHVPGDPRYDEQRMPWNRRIDAHPAVVAEATGPKDVLAAVRVAREHSLPFAVQATGHGNLALAHVDGGLLVRTPGMAAVEVDPERRTARVGTGALWSDVVAAAAPLGLAPLSGTPSVGVTGYTLGGGIGWLSRKYGLACDSLVRAEIVTADGELRTVDAEQHPDLFWALRGGSGNFGVATSLEFRLYPVGQVYAGTSLHSLDRARETLALYREWSREEPDEMNTAVILMSLPDAPMIPEPMRGKQFLSLRAFHLGTAEDGERHFRPLLDAAGPAVMSQYEMMDFTSAGLAIAGPPPPPVLARQQIELCRELPDDLVDVLLEAMEPGSPLTAIEIRHWGGAIEHAGPDAGPAGHRDVPFSVIATAMYPQREMDAVVAPYLEGLLERIRPFSTGGSFLNFLGNPAKAETAFTPENYARLREIKRTWDPDNFFHVNHNIPPL
ncbi:FAD-binding oxidoreductase [Streptosporangium sp. NPDC048865]|uniref:FAD-binding oxidoreductase n=1 Tax=Streptosporangium sp. NPDC048865 TaxID=3155766 RepID=UPI00342299E0